MGILRLKGSIQSNPVNIDTNGARECSYLERSVINVKKHFLLEHTKEIKEEISMVKLNISNYHKVIIQLTNCPGTLKKNTHLLLLKENHSMHNKCVGSART